jgi:GNAT superfamily N-acetyltransferase
MNPDYVIRPALEPDLAEIMVLLENRVTWLRDRGSDQWPNVGEWRPVLQYLIRRRHTWVLATNDERDEIVGTITLTRDPEFDFWNPQERDQSALYVSKLATAVSHRGLGLGELMLDWAIDRAARHDIRTVRLDVWWAAEGLHCYYQKRGWHHVRTVRLEHRRSGTLFERTAVRDDPPLREIENPSVGRHRAGPRLTAFGAQTAPTTPDARVSR